MNTLIFVLFVLAVAVVLALVAMEDPGYVLIARAPYEIEISLALFALLAVLGFGAAYLLARFLIRTMSARRDVARWNQRRNRERAGRDILNGYARLIEGDFREAERELIQRLEHSETPLLNHLGAAYAAQQQGDYARRDQYLDAASASGRRYRDAVSLTRARLQYQAGQLEQSRKTIEAMSSAMRRRPVVERMEAEVLRSLQDYAALEKRLPRYRRHQAFSAEEMAELEQRTFGRLLRLETETPKNSNELTRAWSSLPQAERHNPDVFSAYVTKLVETGDVKRAADQVRTEMHRHWNPDLLPLFVSLGEERHEQIRQLLVWLEKHPDDPRLLYTVANLKNIEGDTEAAQTFYSRAIRNGAEGKAFLELGELLERAGEKTEALRCYRRGLELREAQGRVPAIGAPPQSSTANSKES